MQENKKIDLFLTAISPYTQTNIINNDEKKINYDIEINYDNLEMVE